MNKAGTCLLGQRFEQDPAQEQAVNKRIANKIRKRWKEAFEQDQRMRSFQHEVGPGGQALRDALGKFRSSGTTQLKSQYETGWWPQDKLRSHLKIKTRARYSKQQVQQAFNRLSREEQTEWLIDSALVRVWIEQDARKDEPLSWGDVLEVHNTGMWALSRMLNPDDDPEPVSEEAA